MQDVNCQNLVLSWLKKEDSTTFDKNDQSNVRNKILYLNPDYIYSETDHNKEVLKTYLSLVIQNDASRDDFNVLHSFKDELMLKINFETKQGEEIVYIDKELDIPVYLLAKINLTLKITDTYNFIKFIDINLQQLTPELIISKLFPIISTILRSAILRVITEKNICYYDLTKYYSEISNILKMDLQNYFRNCGLFVTQSFIKNTYIPNGADKIFENQKIEFMQREKNLALQHKAEVLALENYEKKAQIHTKYPQFEIGLTEKEKDNAIDRYLIKEMGYKQEKFETMKQVSIAEREQDLGKINNIKDNPLNLKVSKSNLLKNIISIVLGILSLVLGIVNLSIGYSNIVPGIMLIILSIIVFGVLIFSVVKENKISEHSQNINTDTKEEPVLEEHIES